jgi:hypothetical protein
VRVVRKWAGTGVARRCLMHGGAPSTECDSLALSLLFCLPQHRRGRNSPSRFSFSSAQNVTSSLINLKIRHHLHLDSRICLAAVLKLARSLLQCSNRPCNSGNKASVGPASPEWASSIPATMMQWTWCTVPKSTRCAGRNTEPSDLGLKAVFWPVMHGVEALEPV